MGIVNIEDELHEQLRRASKASCRSINAQAAFRRVLALLDREPLVVDFDALD